MNKFQKFLKDLFDSFLSIIKIILISRFFTHINKNKTNQNEVVILANGPCLKQDLNINRQFILKRTKFCVNFFALSGEYEIVKPEYYVLAAPEFWLPKTTDFFGEKKESLIKTLLSKTNWRMKILIPFKAKESDFVNRVSQNKQIEFLFYNNTPVEGLTSLSNLLFKLNLGMPRPHNVLVPSIFLALNLGFKKIIIFGADHSWHEEIKIDESNTVMVNHEHFYDTGKVQMPMYKLEGEKYFIHDVFRKLHFAFKGYFVLRDYADFLDARIFNASSKSYIDAFDRIKI
ncbi:MAG: hypothetical protein GYA14_00545 [Ignavibacteria bacterium]|nr:hypothetical protein [Ignavibacteria bacterium]